MTNKTIGSCVSCGIEQCFLHEEKKSGIRPDEQTAYFVDELWPEYDAYLSKHLQPQDLFFSTLKGRAWKFSKYAWSVPLTQKKVSFPVLGLLRSLSSRRLSHESGAVRQKNNLVHADLLARAFAKKLPYQTERLVLFQDFLPTLKRLGVLGGRRYTVLMTRYPFRVLQEKLNRAYELHPESPTLKDFRVPETRVREEWDALEGAEALVTPHRDIASLFPDKTFTLDWNSPAAPASPVQGKRVAFLGPTLGRKGAYDAREVAKKLKEPLIVFGANLETSEFWKDIPIESRAFSDEGLNDVGSLLYPVVVDNNPRKLLKARALGVKIFSTKECGLPSNMYEEFGSFKIS